MTVTRVTSDKSNPSWDCYVMVTGVTSDRSNPSWDWVVTVTRVTVTKSENGVGTVKNNIVGIYLGKYIKNGNLKEKMM